MLSCFFTLIRDEPILNAYANCGLYLGKP